MEPTKNIFINALKELFWLVKALVVAGVILSFKIIKAVLLGLLEGYANNPTPKIRYRGLHTGVVYDAPPMGEPYISVQS